MIQKTILFSLRQDLHCFSPSMGTNQNTRQPSDLEFASPRIIDVWCIAFCVQIGNLNAVRKASYSFRAPTTAVNLLRVLRAIQLKRPILMEGSPGVGKTSLVNAIAKSSGRNLVRINLSEQTDFADLIGTDMPCPESSSGLLGTMAFSIRFKAGDWVLLDELNLASQSVLEGLNACLDHRGMVYIPEIDKSFVCPPSFRIFAAQNPLQEGGGRKGSQNLFSIALRKCTWSLYVGTI